MIAVAAALLEKCAKLSASHWSGADDARARAHALRLQSEDLIEADFHAYMTYQHALRAARGLAGDARAAAVGPAHAEIVAVPVAIISSAARAVDLAAELAERGNPNLRTDAVVAARLAAAAAEAGAILVAVNLADAPGDPRSIAAHRLAESASTRAGSLG